MANTEYFQACSCPSNGGNLLHCAPCPPPMLSYRQFQAHALSQRLCHEEVCSIARRCKLREVYRDIIEMECPAETPTGEQTPECDLKCIVIMACILGAIAIIFSVIVCVICRKKQKKVKQDTICDVLNDGQHSVKAKQSKKAKGGKTWTNYSNEQPNIGVNGGSLETESEALSELNHTSGMKYDPGGTKGTEGNSDERWDLKNGTQLVSQLGLSINSEVEIDGTGKFKEIKGHSDYFRNGGNLVSESDHSLKMEDHIDGQTPEQLDSTMNGTHVDKKDINENLKARKLDNSFKQCSSKL